MLPGFILFHLARRFTAYPEKYVVINGRVNGRNLTISIRKHYLRIFAPIAHFGNCINDPLDANELRFNLVS